MRLGVLGGGQLARMLALAAHPLGVTTTVLDPAADACAAAVADHIHAPWDDRAAIEHLAACADVITYEFENVPPATLAAVGDRVPVRPALAALERARDRAAEKALFASLGIDTADWRPVDDLAALRRAAGEVGLPAVLKRRSLGYDGKGQAVIREAGELPAAWRAIGASPAILEAWVPYEREVSVVAVRGRDGRVAFWPLAENVHEQGILRQSVSRPGDPRSGHAEEYAARLLEALGYVGVLALELFEVDGRLLANELAPRVHNSGHWTIEGAETSQFENHVRAVMGLPLGSTAPRGLAAMVNFIGAVPPAREVLALPGVHLHDYAKAPRPGRKVGHATVTADDAVTLGTRLEALRALAAAHQGGDGSR